MKTKKFTTSQLTILGLMAGILFLMAYTPLGYLNIGPLAVTFNVIPVAVCAIVLGPTGGAIAGAVFGLTSFMQAIGIGGVSALGSALFQINPFMTAVQCFGPRILDGICIGFIYRAVHKKANTYVSCAVTGFFSAFLNTLFFMTALIVMFGNTELIRNLMGGHNIIVGCCLMVGDTGAGKMPEPEMLLDYILREIAKEKDLLGRKVLVTAGPTQEAIDPVRYITNHSSGKMGYALAKAAMLRGADVTLVSGPCAIEPPPFVKLVPVVTAKEMFDAVTSVSFEQDIIIKAAAVADYRPANVYEDKVKKHEEQMSIKLEKTDDILGYLGEHRLPGQFLCGFSMETQNMLGNSRAKLGKKHLDMVAANNLKVAGAGFQGDTNVLTLITQDEDVSLQLMSKEDAANVILDKILSIQKEREEQ